MASWFDIFFSFSHSIVSFVYYNWCERLSIWVQATMMRFIEFGVGSLSFPKME